jgi:hypothetical protein
MESSRLDDIEWLEPWIGVEDRARESTERELTRELAAGHVLFGRKARAVGRRQDQDDVLFALDGPRQFAVVHLTYARETRPEFPHTLVFESIQEFVEGCMLPDHEEFTDEDVD